MQVNRQNFRARSPTPLPSPVLQTGASFNQTMEDRSPDLKSTSKALGAGAHGLELTRSTWVGSFPFQAGEG